MLARLQGQAGIRMASVGEALGGDDGKQRLYGTKERGQWTTIVQQGLHDI